MVTIVELKKSNMDKTPPDGENKKSNGSWESRFPNKAPLRRSRAPMDYDPFMASLGTYIGLGVIVWLIMSLILG